MATPSDVKNVGRALRLLQRFQHALEDCDRDLRKLTSGCGARLPGDVLDYDVEPCHLPTGHEGEHRGMSEATRAVVAWIDGGMDALEEPRVEVPPPAGERVDVWLRKATTLGPRWVVPNQGKLGGAR